MSDPIISTDDLSKNYGSVVGLDGLSIDVERGEVFGFLGPNGAGKTTAIRLLLDLIRPSRGEARLFGRPVGDPRLRDGVGYLPGELSLDGRLTGLANLQLLASLRLSASRPVCSRKRLELCERLVLAESDLARRVREYSRGMKQKLGIISALQHDPELLILDEPTTGLDPLVREALFEIMLEAGRAGKTVFHSSHVLSEVDRTCTRVAIVKHGRLLKVMSSADIRSASTRLMVVRFVGDAPADELRMPGIELLELEGSRVVLRVSGELDPLLALLARHSVQDLVFPEPSLEEAFIGLYREDEGAQR
jgi:ABC-2 type transport system ATP-binding protein